MDRNLIKNQEADRQLDSKVIKYIEKEISKFHDDLSVRYDRKNKNFKIEVNPQNYNDPDAVIHKKYWNVLVSNVIPIYSGTSIYKKGFHLKLKKREDGKLMVNLDKLKQNLLAEIYEYYEFLQRAEKIKSFLSDSVLKITYEIRSENSIYYSLYYDKYKYWTLRVSDHPPKPGTSKPDFELRYSKYFQDNFWIRLNELKKRINCKKELVGV